MSGVTSGKTRSSNMQSPSKTERSFVTTIYKNNNNGTLLFQQKLLNLYNGQLSSFVLFTKAKQYNISFAQLKICSIFIYPYKLARCWPGTQYAVLR